FSDHYVVIAEDCVGSDDQALHEASLVLMRHRFDMASGAKIAETWRTGAADNAAGGSARAHS
ncbi:MAG: hypothetical protein QOC68_4558, partial [Solirubrobacteraceae bacterium]|nr:hypothetical protein [Solirubrobacteraceae bacterium]